MNEIQAYEKCQQAIGLKGQIESAYLHLASLLKDIRDNVLYQPQYSNFDEFLQELDMSKGTASRMISSYEKLILEYGLDEKDVETIGWSKGYLVSRLAKDKSEAKELVELAQTQTSRDLELSLKESKGVNQMTCEHELQTLNICKKCGLKYYEEKK